jgi:hypothetical protein
MNDAIERLWTCPCIYFNIFVASLNRTFWDCSGSLVELMYFGRMPISLRLVVSTDS